MSKAIGGCENLTQIWTVFEGKFQTILTQIGGKGAFTVPEIELVKSCEKC